MTETTTTFPPVITAALNKISQSSAPPSALQLMLAAAATEGATEQSILDAIAPFLPDNADTLRLRSIARRLIKDAAAARVRAEHTSQLIATALAGYPHNIGPAPIIVDAAPFIGRPSVFTRKGVA